MASLVKTSFLSVVVIIIISIVSAQMESGSEIYNTVGNACTSNSSCTGQNEFCQTISWLNPPCATGMCQCLPCHTTGDFSGITWTSNPCMPMEPLNIGDTCTGSYNEIILSINAMCNEGFVTCMPGSYQNGSICLPLAFISEGDACQADPDCGSHMTCFNHGPNYGSLCTCATDYSHYDPNSGECVTNNLGDMCGADFECQVFGQNWDGYTYSSGNCNSSSQCDCTVGVLATASYIDGINGVLKNMSICLTAESSPGNTSLGDVCSTDPVYDGVNSSVKVCSPKQVCFSCPEDPTWKEGKCRQVIAPVPAPVCYVRPTVPPTTTPPPISASAAVASLSWFAGWSDLDFMIAAVVNGTYPGYNALRQCSTHLDCNVNEKCVMPYQCGRGFCWCIQPHFYDENNICQLAASTTSTISVSTSPTIETISTTLTWSESTTTEAPDGYYGMECSMQTDCRRVGFGVSGAVAPNNLVCTSNGTGIRNYCLCYGKQLTWHESTQQCGLRDYGDPCSTDSDCNTGLYTKLDANGYSCSPISKTCDCSEDFTVVTGSILVAAWGTKIPSYVHGPTINRKYCVVKSGLTNDLPVNSNCTINFIYLSDRNTSVCSSGLFCLACPLDIVVQPATPFGTCAKFVNPNAGAANGAQKAAGPGRISPLFILLVCLFRSIFSSSFPKIMMNQLL